LLPARKAASVCGVVVGAYLPRGERRTWLIKDELMIETSSALLQSHPSKATQKGTIEGIDSTDAIKYIPVTLTWPKITIGGTLHGNKLLRR
jgi:hypothetical protein